MTPEKYFFEPAWQETDHTEVYGHLTSVMNLVDGVRVVNIPKGVNTIMAQAVSQNVCYTLSGTNPTATSGFVLIAGSDPIKIHVGLRTTLKVHAAANGARLELQFGIM